MTQMALVIDLNVCVGCHACVTSCKEWNTSGSAGYLADDRPYDEDPTGTFFNRVQTFEVSPEVMHSISDADTPPGAVAVAPFVDVDPTQLLDSGSDLLVVLAEVRDPGNLGTILRTARAAGAGGVFLTKGTVDVYNPKVVRASAGALFHVSVAREVAVPWVLTELGARNIRRVAADPTATATYDEVDMRGPSALVFGNEAWGLPGEAVATVDERASIPMRASAESLNVGIAAAVFLFEAVRQRRRR